MLNFFLIVICLSLGVILQKVKSFPENGHSTLNFFVLYFALPSMTFLNVPLIEWRFELLALCFVSWISFLLGYLFFSFLGKRFNWQKETIGCLILTAGLGNTSFVGFPVIEFVLGKSALRYALLVDQAGTFLVCSTFGLVVAFKFNNKNLKHSEILRRILIFPPFISFILAFFIGLIGWRVSGIPALILERFSLLLAPLALISVGLHMKMNDVKKYWDFLGLGLLFKLIIVPCVIFFVFKIIPVPKDIFNVIFVESAMAPMLTASIVAINEGLQPKLASLMVSVGVPLSFITLGFLHFGLNFF